MINRHKETGQETLSDATDYVHAAFMMAYNIFNNNRHFPAPEDIALLQELTHAMEKRGRQLHHVTAFWEAMLTTPQAGSSATPHFPAYGPETVILVVAPSGAGKSTFCQKLLDNELPHITQAITAKTGTLKRFDLKGHIPHHVMEEGTTLVLECCIDRFCTPESPLKGSALLTPLITQARNLVIMTLEVDRKEIARRYFNRIIRGAKQRHHDVFSLWGLLHYRKYRTALKYYCTRDIDKSYAAWKASRDAFRHPHYAIFQHITLSSGKDGGYRLQSTPPPQG